MTHPYLIGHVEHTLVQRVHVEVPTKVLLARKVNDGRGRRELGAAARAALGLARLEFVQSDRGRLGELGVVLANGAQPIVETGKVGLRGDGRDLGFAQTAQQRTAQAAGDNRGTQNHGWHVFLVCARLKTNKTKTKTKQVNARKIVRSRGRERRVKAGKEKVCWCLKSLAE